MKTRTAGLTAACAAALALGALSSTALADGVRAYGPIPSPNTGEGEFGARPHGLVAAEGAIWFTQFRDDEIGRLDPISGAIVDIPLPDSPAGRSSRRRPRGIVHDAARNRLWWTEFSAGRIGWLDPRSASPAVMEVDVEERGPNGIALGPDGKLWVSLRTTGELLRFDPDNGTQTRYSLIGGDGSVLGLEDVGVDAAGRVWAAALDDDAIYFLDPATADPGVPGSGVARYPVGAPVAISVAPNGRVWTGAVKFRFLVRLQPSALVPGSGTDGITGFGVDANPHGVLADNSGAWFADYGSSLDLSVTSTGGASVGRFDLGSNEVEVFPLLPGSVPDLHPQRIVKDAAGDIWVTETKANRISVLDLGATSVPGATPVTSEKVALPNTPLPAAPVGPGATAPGVKKTRVRVLRLKATRNRVRQAGRRVPGRTIRVKGLVRPKAGARARRSVLVQRRVVRRVRVQRGGTLRTVSRVRWATVKRATVRPRNGSFQVALRSPRAERVRVRVLAKPGFLPGRSKIVRVRAVPGRR